MDGGELGHFSLLERIGEGGMGRVYKARDKRLDRLVAIKLLAEARSTDADRRARFVQEAKAASALNHPNIITIHEIGEQDGQTFIVMELVDGKPLNELIPRKGMRLTEALRIAAQVADALTAAHAAGIVHRDLKPANIMVDAHGRAKVLDFGLAKLTAPAAVGADETTRSLAVDQPITGEGVIFGSAPYMSPEQAEGKPLDARTDIFSFGTLLYEMITGQRAFRGASRASTLAAIIEKDPPPASELISTTPRELERLITRCLRKDVNRRSQHMADVKLSLEELREESESGKLARTAAAAAGTGVRRWVWPAVAVACMLIAVAALTGIYLNLHRTESSVPALVQVSPPDGHSYFWPAISPDGGFVAYVSDRSGKKELWLQQVGGGDPIQLTHSDDEVNTPAFFPDSKRILYTTMSADGKGSVDVISTLGGQPRMLAQGENASLSPDGRLIAYFENNEDGARLMTISSNGGQPRELSAWKDTNDTPDFPAWTSDSRPLLCLVPKKSKSANSEKFEWDAFPVDGGSPVETGAAHALGAAGLSVGYPILMTGDRVLFVGEKAGRYDPWEIRLSRDSWRVQGVPQQLTGGPLSGAPASISSTGTVALEFGDAFTDFYLIPLSPVTGQPTGAVRQLTRDARYKSLWNPGGHPSSVYFAVKDGVRSSAYSLELASARQTLVAAGLPSSCILAISPDGRQFAYSVEEGNSNSIRVGDTGAGLAETRVLCKACGVVEGFSPDGRFLFYDRDAKVRDAKVKNDPKRRWTVRLLELASGEDRPWLVRPTDSVFFGGRLGQDSRWLWVALAPPGLQGPWRRYIVPWREEPIPQPEWTKIPLPEGTGNIPPWRVSPTGNFFYFFKESKSPTTDPTHPATAQKLMTLRFDPQTARFGEPHEVKFLPGSTVTLKPGDLWAVRGPGLVFSRWEIGSSSVWLMKLPR